MRRTADTRKSGKKRTKVEEKENIEHRGYKIFRRKLTISRIQERNYAINIQRPI